MSRHHPLDKVFRDKLQDQAATPPLHLWEQIGQQRTLKHRILNQARHKKPIVTILAATVLTGLAFLVWNIQQPDLHGFPVPIAPAGQPALAEQRGAHSGSLTQSVPDKMSEQPLTSDNTPAFIPLANDAAENVLTTTAAGQLASSSMKAARAIAITADLITGQARAAAPAGQPSVSPRRIPDLPVLARSYEAEKGVGERYLTGLFDSNDPKCARFGDGNWAIYLDVIASPDLTFNNLEARSPEDRDYLEKRKETESRLFAFSGGVRLSMVADNGIALRTGVNYSQINEKFTYFNGSEEITQTRNIYDSDGNVIGTDTITLTGERYKVSNNIYRTIDIPFILGYEFEAGQFGMSINGGAYLNLLFMPDGDLLDPQTLEPIAIERNGFDAFKEQVGLGYYGSLGLTYQTGNGLQLLLEPHFKVFPKSITQDEYALTQRYTSVGLFMGVRKRL